MKSESILIQTIFKKYKYILFIVCCSLVLLYFIKKDSADGRLIIWRTTLEMIEDTPLLGHGIGGFQANYMIYQARTLQTISDDKWRYLADNVVHPFNEYLKIGVEFGAVIMILFIIGSVILLRKLYCSRKKLYFEILIALAICGLFSYPLYYPMSWIMLAYAITNIHNRKKYSIRLHYFVIYIFMISLLIQFYNRVCSEYKWKVLSQKVLICQSGDLTSDYDRLYERMKTNPSFIYNYCAYLSYTKKYAKSAYIISNSNVIRNYDLQLLIADNYMGLNQYSDAEKNYILASNMCPNRFIPLYQLFKLYRTTGHTDKAYNIGSVILNKRLKVSSRRIDQIKYDVEDKLYNTDSIINNKQDISE